MSTECIASAVLTEEIGVTAYEISLFYFWFTFHGKSSGESFYNLGNLLHEVLLVNFKEKKLFCLP